MYIKFNYLLFRNFLSYPATDTKFIFDKGLISILASNGAGKSAIIDALTYTIINMSYANGNLPANIIESTLRLYYYNVSADEWTRYDGAGVGGVNTAENYCWANTTHFSTWAIFGTVNNGGGGGGSGGSGGGIAALPAEEEEEEEEPEVTPTRPTRPGFIPVPPKPATPPITGAAAGVPAARRPGVAREEAGADYAQLGSSLIYTAFILAVVTSVGIVIWKGKKPPVYKHRRY